MMRLELRHLECLVAVAREGHFGRAAVAMGVGQPYVSLTIQRLEDALGEKLVIRRPSARLTPAGEVMVRHVRRALSEVNRGASAVREIAAGERGELHLGFPNWMVMTPIFDRIAAFRASFPSVAISYVPMSMARQLDALSEGDIDVAFVREPSLDETEFAAVPLLREPFLLAVGKGHELAGRDEIPFDAMADEPFLLFPRELAPGFHDLVERILQARNIRPQSIETASDWLTILGLVRIGSGVALVPASLSQLGLPGVRFVPLISLDEVSTVSAVTVIGQRRRLVRTLISVLAERSAGARPDSREPA